MVRVRPQRHMEKENHISTYLTATHARAIRPKCHVYAKELKS